MLWIKRIQKGLYQTLYPSNPACAVCGRSLIFKNDVVCSHCARKITYIGGNACKMCGDILNENEAGQLCERCCRSDFSFSGGVTLFVYDQYSKGIIWDFKFNHNPDAAYQCGLKLADKLLETEWFASVDIITCVPAGAETLDKRGYNQSAVIADAMKEKCDIIVNNNLLVKLREPKDQIGLNAEERRENMKQVFGISDPDAAKGKNVLVVDDVFTTGSTMNACSHVLIEAGAAKVYSAVVTSAFIDKNISK